MNEKNASNVRLSADLVRRSELLKLPACALMRRKDPRRHILRNLAYPAQSGSLRYAKGDYGYPYAAAADGSRFLINTRVEAKNPAPLTIGLNWTASLKHQQ